MVLRTDAFDVEGFPELSKQLNRLISSDREMEERLRGLIREVLNEARSELAADARSGLQMQGDPRQSYKAVRSVVYRQILGGSVNILRKKRAGTPKDMWLPSGRTGRGGNRRARGGRTKQLQGYWGADRGFILRFLNAGAQSRSIKNYKTDARRIDGSWPSVTKWSQHPNTGNRGSIAARNWFGNAGQRVLEQAADKFTAYVEQLIAERFM